MNTIDLAIKRAINRRSFWVKTPLVGERECIIDSRGRQRVARAVRQVLSTASMSVAAAMVVLPAPVFAQTSTDQTAGSATEQGLAEVVVTGTRIIREGYEAPTPLTVVSEDTLQKSANTDVVETLATLPEMTGASTSAIGAVPIGQGSQDLQALNLRSLGANRVLVLLDGERVVGSNTLNEVDIAAFPQQLIQRVDIVTGGASAVYGSDAVGGVVNFILDKTFTGVKAEVSGGETNYGDDRNFKIDFTAGDGFDDNRGHILISGEQLHNDGITGDGGRPWDRQGWLQITNPAYTSTNGQPQYLVEPQTAYSTATAGGIIIAGPLKGTAFGSGGSPYQFQYGSIVSPPNMALGGNWQQNNIQPLNSIDPAETVSNVFTRISYDVTDNIEAFVQYAYSNSVTSNSEDFPQYALGSAAFQISANNPYLPTSVHNAMVADGLTSVEIGSWNADMPPVSDQNSRVTQRLNFGFNGKFDALGSSWNWKTYYAYGGTNISLQSDPYITSRYEQAINAVVNPANGQIVCASVLAGANNGCLPWNALGVGVNAGNQAAFQWMDGGGSWERGLIKEETEGASITGNPFSDWAGPVSLALDAEHRADSVDTQTDPYSYPSTRFLGNYAPIRGKESVTEGALETVVPLLKGVPGVQELDANGAARATDYSTSGYVTTYKYGLEYTPIQDIRFRATRSRDIRAPSINELYSPPIGSPTGATIVTDRSLNEAVPPGGFIYTAGNPNLQPEKATSADYGVVLQPRFLEGFQMSVDYWDVNIAGAIQSISAQQVIDSCYYGYFPAECADITRGASGAITALHVAPINLATQDVRGVDLEAGYHLQLAKLVDDWRGDLSLRGLMTFYLRDLSESVFAVPDNVAGQNTGANPPNWKLNITTTYQLNPFAVSLTGRAFDAGTINNLYLACTSGCPPSTATATTINENHMAGEFYLDANVSYKFDIGKSNSEVFFSVTNLLNRGLPTPNPAYTAYYYIGSENTLYDQFGAVYRAGIRIRM